MTKTPQSPTPNPNPNPTPNPNPNPTPQGSDNFFLRVAKFIQKHPLIVAFFIICTVGGTMFRVGLQYQKNLDQNKMDGLISELNTVKTQKGEVEKNYAQLKKESDENYAQLKKDYDKVTIERDDWKEKYENEVNCTGSITEPSNGATVGRRPNINISVRNCSQTRVWLVAIPNAQNDTQNDCYLIGEAVKGRDSQMNAHPLQQSKPYIVRLFENSEDITKIPKNSTDGYSCSAIGASESLDEVQVTVN